MTTKQQHKLDNLTTQALSLQAEITELKQECQESIYWEPVHKEEGWYVDGSDITSCLRWNGHYDIAMINRGQVFKTKAEAQQELELQQATYRLKKAIWKANGGTNREFIANNISYFIYYNHIINELAHRSTAIAQSQPNWMYIRCEEEALNLMETHKQDFLTYFGIVE